MKLMVSKPYVVVILAAVGVCAIVLLMRRDNQDAALRLELATSGEAGDAAGETQAAGVGIPEAVRTPATPDRPVEVDRGTADLEADDPAIRSCDWWLGELETPLGRAKVAGGHQRVSIEVAESDPQYNPRGLELTDAERQQLRAVLQPYTDKFVEAAVESHRRYMNAIKAKVKRGDFVDARSDDPDIMTRVLTDANATYEAQHGKVPGGHVTVAGVPGVADGLSRVMVFVRGDTEGYIEAKDRVAEALNAREEAIKNYIASLVR